MLLIFLGLNNDRKIFFGLRVHGGKISMTELSIDRVEEITTPH
jgi:hypothetical protein